MFKNNTLYNMILSDSFGGVMYDVANYTKYDPTEMQILLQLIESTHESDHDGITKGVKNFIKQALQAQ